MIDIAASLLTLKRNEHDRGHGPLKIAEDIDRYETIIERTKPDLIIETGTRNGDSARWFHAAAGCPVITIDLLSVDLPVDGWLTTIRGSSIDPRVVHRVVDLAAPYERVMVSLDSDHSAAHVGREIAWYGTLVSPGCYLVIEDGIFHYADEQLRAQHGLADMVGDPLTAVVESNLGRTRYWVRDTEIENMWHVTHNPAGWWMRTRR